MKLVKVVFIGILCVYAGILLLVYFLQSRLIFFPERLPSEFEFSGEARELWLDTPDGERINALFFPNKGKDVILYFHGNAGSLRGWQGVREDFADTDYSLFLIDYRGYGKSSGRPSETGLNTDAVAAYQYLEKHYQPENIIVYGRSIGSGVAVELCAQYPTKGLILESGYSSVVALAEMKAPWLLPRLLLTTRFENIKKLNRIKAPLLLIHGTDDELIPPAQSEMLFNAFGGRKKIFLITGGGHNDLNTFDEYQRIIQEELGDHFK